jgi:hypothetical protein
MRKFFFVFVVAGAFLGAVLCNQSVSQEIKGEACFFLKSLHYTAGGMGYWYSKENGGLELLTGIPYNDLGCKNCHVQGCDTCHKAERASKVSPDCKLLSYTIDAAKKQDMCLTCHGREKAMIGINHKQQKEDVHVLLGMVCGDCHSAREMHGDGTVFISLKEPGAMDTQCEGCHDAVKPTESHTVHEGKLDCKACHVRHVVSCTNCHFDTLVEKGKRKAIPVSGWVFLINYKDKVTSGSMQTFVTKGNKTFLMFAPHMGHAVTKEGRACDACHGIETMKDAQQGKIRLLWLEDGKVMNRKGVIPVVDEVDYECVYQDLKDDNWVPIENPLEPVRHYAAFGKPLTKEQLAKLAKVQEAPPPKMQ